jgi:hypothetical protein
MKTRNSALFALGLAAAITIGGTVTAGAQTPRRRATPQRRIPVRKDVPVAAAAPRVDTVTVTRVDTVTVRRTDTVTTTVMRYDTVTRMVYPPLQRLPGFFIGLGAGADIPMNDIRAVLKDGPAGQFQLGYFPMNSFIGIRGDLTYGKVPIRDRDFPRITTDPKLFTAGGDLIIRFPLDRTSKLNPVLYAFGGGGYANFSDVTRGTYPAQPFPLPVARGQTLDITKGHGYYDFGPGVDFSVGGLHLYAEGKYMTIMSQGKNSHLFPVYGGIKLY